MIRTHSFRKHPYKLEIKSDGDISDGAFYRSSYNFSIRHRIRIDKRKDAMHFFVCYDFL